MGFVYPFQRFLAYLCPMTLISLSYKSKTCLYH